MIGSTNNGFEVIEDIESKGHTQYNLQLRLGAIYSTLVKAINGANLVASHETIGIQVDNTPPIVR